VISALQNTRSAADQGMMPQAYAQAQASLARRAAEWPDGARIARLRDSAELALYTPGSSAGRSLAALDSSPRRRLRCAPTPTHRDRIQATASDCPRCSLDADPAHQSRAHPIATLRSITGTRVAVSTRHAHRERRRRPSHASA
jgi:hypothetical protein